MTQNKSLHKITYRGYNMSYIIFFILFVFWNKVYVALAGLELTGIHQPVLPKAGIKSVSHYIHIFYLKYPRNKKQCSVQKKNQLSSLPDGSFSVNCDIYGSVCAPNSAELWMWSGFYLYSKYAADDSYKETMYWTKY